MESKHSESNIQDTEIKKLMQTIDNLVNEKKTKIDTITKNVNDIKEQTNNLKTKLKEKINISRLTGGKKKENIYYKKLEYYVKKNNTLKFIKYLRKLNYNI